MTSFEGDRVGHTGRLAAAPWLVQAMWCAGCIPAVMFLRIHDWGMFEVIPWLIALLLAMAGWLAWLIAWSVLAQRSLPSRSLYLVVGLAGLVSIGGWALDWQADSTEVAMVLARVAVGTCIPLVLARRRGWQIQVPQQGEQFPRELHPVWQFSIGDLLVLTAGAASYLGLTMSRSTYPWGEILTECLLVLCGTGILLVGLSWQRFWLAALTASAGTAVLTFAAIGLVNPDFLIRPLEWLIALAMLAPAVLSLLAAIATVRWCGYRLR